LLRPYCVWTRLCRALALRYRTRPCKGPAVGGSIPPWPPLLPQHFFPSSNLRFRCSGPIVSGHACAALWLCVLAREPSAHLPHKKTKPKYGRMPVGAHPALWTSMEACF